MDHGQGVAGSRALTGRVGVFGTPLSPGSTLVESESLVHPFSPGSTLEPGLKGFCRRSVK
jgi:hypothetical protein